MEQHTEGNNNKVTVLFITCSPIEFSGKVEILEMTLRQMGQGYDDDDDVNDP